MSNMTADKFAQKVYELGLADNQQVDTVWSELGTRSISVEEFIAVALRRGVLTNFQVDRILKGERTGYFYGKYKVLYLIGTGSFARVYRAVHTETGRVTAIKVLRKRYRDDPIEFEQFLREGKVGSTLRHINVVPIYEVNSDRREPYMVMEFVEGQTLREMLKIRKKLDPLTSLKILSDVLSGLHYAMEKGISHRDLKMSNVLVSSSGRAKLVDFGLAAAKYDDKELADCPNARAIDYAALERGTGVRKDDARSDLYFAGCLLYNMVTGRPPLFETKDRIQRLNMARFRDIPLAGQVEPGLPQSVLSILYRSMELDPTKRYQTASEMQRDVQAAIRRLEQGETGESTEGTVESQQPAGTESTTNNSDAVDTGAGEVLEGESRTLMIVESNAAMQDLLRDKLKKRGYRVLVIGDYERALGRFHEQLDVADCVLVSTAGLEDVAVEAFNQFGSDAVTKDVPCILLLHQAEPKWLDAASQSKHRIALTAPKLSELRIALLRLLKHTAPTN